MISIGSELRRLSHTLVLRGAIVATAGLVAIVWPEELLIHAMTLVTVIAIMTAAYELTSALLLRRRTSQSWLVSAHSLTILAFGTITFFAPRILLRAPLFTIAIIDILLFAVAWVSISIALYHPAPRPSRWGLWLWAGVNVALAVLATTSPLFNIFSLLYFGAVYAAALGMVEFVAGFSIIRAVGRGRRSEHRSQLVLLG